MNDTTYDRIMDVQNRRPTPKPLGGAGDPARKAVFAHLVR